MVIKADFDEIKRHSHGVSLVFIKVLTTEYNRLDSLVLSAGNASLGPLVQACITHLLAVIQVSKVSILTLH